MRKYLIGFLGILPLVSVLFVYSSLPDQIPVHYGFNGLVDRYGGKIELIWISLYAILLTIVYFGLIYYLRKRKDESETNEILLSDVLIWILSFYDLVTILMIYCAHNTVKDLYSINGGKILLVGLSILFILIGNILPKIKKNFYLGIRFPWIYQNNEVWKKTQRLSGYLFFFGGIASLIMSLVLPSIWAIILFLILILLEMVYIGIYSYNLAKKLS